MALFLALVLLQPSTPPSTEALAVFESETTQEQAAVVLYEQCVGLMVDVLMDLECSAGGSVKIKSKAVPDAPAPTPSSFEQLVECVKEAREKAKGQKGVK